MESSLERQSGIERVANVVPTEELEILAHFRELLERKQARWFEREKSEVEQEIVRDVLAHLPEFIRDFGGHPVPNLTSENVHVLDVSQLTDEQRNAIKNERGWYNVPDQAVFVYPDSLRLRAAEAIVHELMHFNSFSSLSLATEDQHGPAALHVNDRELLVRRIGLSVFDRSNSVRFFRNLDEAVIEELTKRFDDRYFRFMPALADELGKRDLVRHQVNRNSGDIAAVVTRQPEDGMWQTEILPYAYAKERAHLNALVLEIYNKNMSDFASEEKVFEIFAEAVFSGRLLRLARLIEKTYGTGAFRKLALETAQIG